MFVIGSRTLCLLTSVDVVRKSTLRCKFLSDYVISTKRSAWRNLRGSAHIKPFSNYAIMSEVEGSPGKVHCKRPLYNCVIARSDHFLSRRGNPPKGYLVKGAHLLLNGRRSAYRRIVQIYNPTTLPFPSLGRQRLMPRAASPIVA